MNTLSDVSETALITLRSRVEQSFKNDPILIDPVGKECLRRIVKSLPEGRDMKVLTTKVLNI